jgi:hypothetical protein
MSKLLGLTVAAMVAFSASNAMADAMKKDAMHKDKMMKKDDMMKKGDMMKHKK